MELEAIGKILSYVITVVIGSVGYKYATLLLGHKDKQENRTDEQAQKLFDNLQKRVDSLTERLIQLEAQKEESHKRELKLAIQLTEAKSEVKLLMGKVESLERNHQTYKDLVEHYKKMLHKYEEE